MGRNEFATRNGINNTNYISNVTQIGTSSNWSRIASGVRSHTLALKEDGTLWAWGLNNHRQLGDGTSNNRNLPTQIGVENDWLEISAGEYFSLAIKQTSSLWAWDKTQMGNWATVHLSLKVLPRINQQYGCLE